MLPLNLSKTEIKRLNYERYHYPDPLVQKRIQAVYLKIITGLSNELTGVLADLNRDSVGYWINPYRQGGFDALCQVGYGTNKSEPENYAGSILESFIKQPPMTINEAKWRIETMTGISRSPSQVRAFMKRHGLRYIKTGHIPAKADAQKQQLWMKTTLEPAIEEAQNGECHLLFMDAAHFILEPFICALWCVARLFIKASSGRNRINVPGAVDAITKQVITLNNTTFINAETIIAFLKQLREVYVDLPLKIVLDNARYQHCKLVENAARELGITLLFFTFLFP